MAKSSIKTQVRPLLIRPGARYRCFGDGLCCTDIHVLGPLSRKERKLIRNADPEGAERDDDDEWVIGTAPDGGCHFLMADMRCRIHAEAGPQAKPDFCQRFPVGLVATPAGGRVTTHHRCPCRTLGDRPQMTEESAAETLSDSKGRLVADRRVKKIALTKTKKVDFQAWRLVEADMLGRLADGSRPEDVLNADAFPKLKKTNWWAVAEEFRGARDGSQFGFAIGWFAETVIGLLDEHHRVRFPPRPWAAAFERAEAREGKARDVDDVLSDWIADEIWGLAWTDDRTFKVCRVELATRLRVAREIIEYLVAHLALRPDRAAAEALMVVELVGDSEFWSDVVERMKV